MKLIGRYKINYTSHIKNKYTSIENFILLTVHMITKLSHIYKENSQNKLINKEGLQC